jgi:rhombotail lipoprotein
MKNLYTAVCFTLVFSISGCASMLGSQHGHKQVGSVVDYLYPKTDQPPRMQSGEITLRPPVRVGIAFAPGSGAGFPEVEKTRLLDRVKTAFAKHPYISSIELIPTTYLQAKGGFANLEQVARMFNVEVVTLLSYDQVQFNDSNALSVLYWTIVGAYVIKGDQYDIQTMVDASVFDVRSKTLLFRAPGTSQTKGSASMSGFGEAARTARADGFTRAIDDMVPKLQTELDGFRQRIKTDAAFKVENKPGYQGGALD